MRNFDLYAEYDSVISNSNIINLISKIHENYKYIDINQNTILQLHQDLYKYTGYSYGGKFKNS